MALELRQQLKLAQQLIMTPQLQMAIKLLQLNRLELLDTVRQELEENPALEELQDSTPGDVSDAQEETATTDDQTVEEVTIDEKIPDEVDWNNYLEEYNSPGKTTFESEKRETPDYESFLVPQKSLQEHLLWQLLMTSPTPESEKIGSIIIGNLNRDGYLDVSCEEIAEMSDSETVAVEKVLALMQGFDPTGICARDLRECLLIQAKYLNLNNTIVIEIIENHLNHLENRNFKAICKGLRASPEDVSIAVNIIKSLEPKPGRQYSDEEPQYINPDIFVYKLGNEFVIWINDDGLPKLRVNNFYKNALKNDSTMPDTAKDYVQDKMRSAAWLIRSIHQRQKTIFRVMESILKFQREFFDKGIAYLKPMVLREVAEDIGMHESTISRVTTNKYAHTPQGIFELKYFFNSSIRRIDGDAIASASVQDKIRQIIENEDTRKPFSDDKITKILKASNINIARRTVAKYRELMKVLPSNKRKQI